MERKLKISVIEEPPAIQSSFDQFWSSGEIQYG